MAMNRTTKSYARSADVQLLPKLIEVQLESFKLFQDELLRELFEEISPIESFNGEMAIYFPGNYKQAKEYGLTYWFEEPKVSLDECVERDLTYGAPLYAKVALHNRKTDEHKVDTIYFGEFPLMTENGTFIINGTERVVVSQLIRSPGVYFNADEDPASGRPLAQAKLIPDRGAWMEFETRKSDYIVLKFNRKRTIPVTILLRALAAVDDGVTKDILTTGKDEEILALFADVDTNPDHQFIAATIRQEPEWAGRKADCPRGIGRVLQARAPWRPAHVGQRARVYAAAVVRSAPLRPGARRPLQAEPAPGQRQHHSAHTPNDYQARHRGAAQAPDPN